MTPPAEHAIRCESDETCPRRVTAVASVQGAVLGLAPLVLCVAVTAVAGGQDQSCLEWAAFAALGLHSIGTDRFAAAAAYENGGR